MTRKQRFQLKYPWVVVESGRRSGQFGTFTMQIEHRFRDEEGASRFAASSANRSSPSRPNSVEE